MFFAIIFGISLALVGEKGEKVTSLIDRIATVLFKAMGLIVRLLPRRARRRGLTVGRYGVGSLKQLVSWSAVLRLDRDLRRRHPRGGHENRRLNIFKFSAYLREELTIVLATASSDAVLPRIMRKLERHGREEVGRGAVVPPATPSISTPFRST